MVAPDSTSTPAMPRDWPIRTSVSSRSPTTAARPGGAASRRSSSPAMCSLGLPTTASARAPVHASIAASMAAQSGSPPSGVGQYGSGLVATSAAPCSRTAR